MRTHIIVIACVAVSLSFVSASAQHLPTLKSTTVGFPAGDSLFPGGASADAINNNCLACHSTEMVLDQPSLPKAAWEAEVHKMINVYKAPVDEADVAPIVDYLVKAKGAN